MSSSEAGGQTSDWIHMVGWKDPAQCHQCQQQHTAYQVPSTSKGNMRCVLISSQDVPHSGLLRLAKECFLIFSLKYSVLIWSVMSWLCAFVLRHKKAYFSFLCPTEIKILGNRLRLRKTRHYDLVLYYDRAFVIYSRLYVLLFFSYNVVNSTVLYSCNKNPASMSVFIYRWINYQCWILFRICDYLHYCNIVSTY